MAEGTLVRWVIAEGEPVAKGAVLAEIETDKATVEVESAFGGFVLKHLVSQGDVVPVNTPIAVVGAQGESADATRPVDMGASGGEHKPSEREAAPQAAPKAETAAVPVPAQPAVQQPETGREQAGDAGLPGGLRASPLARRIALEKNVDLKAVQGRGPGGRITKRDVEAYLAKPPSAPAQAVAPVAVPSPSLGTPASTPETHRIPLTRLRSAIARRMVEAVTQAPHFFVTHEYDMAAVMELRKQANALLPEEEKLSVNDFIVKAVALALRETPNLNASIDLAKEEIVQHGQVNVGVAVALESGLLTVVCRDADRKPLRQIGSEIRSMVNRAREGKVRPDDIEGSTFTVSNLGMFDVEHFTAIINPPEAAILAVGSVRQTPVVVGADANHAGEIKVGTRMKATLSVDPRVSDGAEGARFLQALARDLETPVRLLL
jgi:pyruvate dehydrogenase E2 component (dihydrolipoamide acetyltransferase)